ncbi:MAG: PepSY domain-containing protein [Geodermatophilaceae bacterium]
MKLNSKRTIVGGALAGMLAIGGAGVALAAANAAPAPGGSGGTSTQEQEQSYTGSVPAPQEGVETEDGPETVDGGAAEADESAALESLATITPEEATTAALAAVPGTAGAAELDSENGYVVYSVPITGADGTTVEVKIDAGNASVLAQETDEGTEASNG